MSAAYPLRLFAVDRYPPLKAQYPNHGRRWLNLKIAEEFWNLPAETKMALSKTEVVTNATAECFTDDDPLDEISLERPEIGLILRTDFGDEVAWTNFYGQLQDGEKEFAELASGEDGMKEDELEPAVDNQPLQTEGGEESDEDSEDSSSVFHVINPSLPEEQTIFKNISNLTALRLLNDVDVRSAPSVPPTEKCIKPANKLVDYDGWQEFYSGKNIWIYDAKSNADQCVRVVSQSGDFYGTASGDSWRARVTHICELQVNIYSGAMKIDFGGLDRWDWNERRRNMDEANLAIAL